MTSGKIGTIRVGLASAMLALAGTPALAQTSVSSPFDWSARASVTAIDGTSAPNVVAFQLAADAGNCTAGSWLTYHPTGPDAATQSANAQALITMLQTANTNNVAVTITGFNAGCVVQTVTLIQ